MSEFLYPDKLAPDIISATPAIVQPGEMLTLKWAYSEYPDGDVPYMGAGYCVYCTDSDGTFARSGPIRSMSGPRDSAQLTAPATMYDRSLRGKTLYYTVTVGDILLCPHRASVPVAINLYAPEDAPTPGTPTVVTVNGESVTHVRPGDSVTLAWSGAEISKWNDIVHYNILRDGELYVEGIDPTVSRYTVPAHDEAGHEYRYSVVVVAWYSSSAPSAPAVVRSYSAPSAPTAISASTTTPVANSTVLLTWGGAQAGDFNAIRGYEVHSSTSFDGLYSRVMTVYTTDAATTVSVPAPAGVGGRIYYRVRTLGTHSDSALSGLYVVLTATAASEDGDHPVTVKIDPRRGGYKRRGLVLGDYDTAQRGPWTLATWKLSTPTYQTTWVTVPGRRKGPIDMTAVLTDGEPAYDTRTLTATLECSAGTRDDRVKLIRDLVNQLDGRSVHITVPDDPGHYLVGRVSIAEDFNTPAHARVTVTATCEPWRYRTVETCITVTAKSGDQMVHLPNDGRCILVPDVTVTGEAAAVTIRCNGKDWTLAEGDYHILDLSIPVGGAVLTYVGAGTVSITYREAVL